MRRLLAAVAAWLDAAELERERYLTGDDEIRDAYLAGYAAGLRDAPLVRL